MLNPTGRGRFALDIANAFLSAGLLSLFWRSGRTTPCCSFC